MNKNDAITKLKIKLQLMRAAYSRAALALERGTVGAERWVEGILENIQDIEAELDWLASSKAVA